MHVDEVQIDGGGTEAVITGNMENPGKRLIVLEGDEVEALYGRPRFTHEERGKFALGMEKMTSVFAMAIQRLTRKPKRLRLASIIFQLLEYAQKVPSGLLVR